MLLLGAERRVGRLARLRGADTPSVMQNLFVTTTAFARLSMKEPLCPHVEATLQGRTECGTATIAGQRGSQPERVMIHSVACRARMIRRSRRVRPAGGRTVTRRPGIRPCLPTVSASLPAASASAANRRSSEHGSADSSTRPYSASTSAMCAPSRSNHWSLIVSSPPRTWRALGGASSPSRMTAPPPGDESFLGQDDDAVRGRERERCGPARG